MKCMAQRFRADTYDIRTRTEAHPHVRLGPWRRSTTTDWILILRATANRTRGSSSAPVHGSREELGHVLCADVERLKVAEELLLRQPEDTVVGGDVLLGVRARARGRVSVRAS